MFISFSIKLNINIFSLNNWLDISIIINFFTWSSNSLCSSSFLKNRFSINWCFSLILWLRFLKFDGFSIINNSFLNNRLSINFFSWSLDNFINNFFTVFSLSSLYRHIINLCFTSIKLNLYIFSQNGWLNIFFSNSSFTRYINRYWSCRCFSIYNWL